MSKYKLVPAEPTPEMVEAARDQHEGEPYLPVSLYKAMINAAPAVQGEPVAYAVFAENGNIRIWCADPIQTETLRQQYGEALQPLYAAPPPATAPLDYTDAYQGAMEDLAIWKRRALEAETTVRKQDKIIDRMGEDLNAINGPTFMGEPVLPKRQPAEQPDVSKLVEALELARDRLESERRSGEWDPLIRDIDDALAPYRKGGEP